MRLDVFEILSDVPTLSVRLTSAFDWQVIDYTSTPAKLWAW